MALLPSALSNVLPPFILETHAVEIKATTVTHLGPCSVSLSPLQTHDLISYVDTFTQMQPSTVTQETSVTLIRHVQAIVVSYSPALLLVKKSTRLFCGWPTLPDIGDLHIDNHEKKKKSPSRPVLEDRLDRQNLVHMGRGPDTNTTSLSGVHPKGTQAANTAATPPQKLSRPHAQHLYPPSPPNTLVPRALCSYFTTLVDYQFPESDKKNKEIGERRFRLLPTRKLSRSPIPSDGCAQVAVVCGLVDLISGKQTSQARGSTLPLVPAPPMPPPPKDKNDVEAHQHVPLWSNELVRPP